MSETVRNLVFRRIGIVGLTIAAALAALPAFAQSNIVDSAVSFLDAPHSFLEPLGPIAADQREHFIKVLLWTGLAILPVYVLTPIILIRYRRTSRASYRPNWTFNPILETFIWGLPIVIVGVLSVQLWQATHRLDPYKPLEGDAVCVQAVGLDWKWLFIYPEEGIATVGELAIPVGRPIAMELTTDTVMQSLRISALTGQIYAMPGMRTELHFLANQTGETRGENTQYNGTGFPEQRFDVRAIPETDWDAWVAGVRAAGIALTDETYATLGIRGDLTDTSKALGTAKGSPIQFADPDPDLFGRILARYHSGVAVDPAGQPGSFVYEPGQSNLPPSPMILHGAGAAGCGGSEHDTRHQNHG